MYSNSKQATTAGMDSILPAITTKASDSPDTSLACFKRSGYFLLSLNLRASGVLIVDYPPEECEEFAKQMRSEGIDPIFLLAPTSSQERIHHAAQIAAGYIYYVSLRGVTGANNLNTQDVASVLPLIRQETSIPVAVGFGIRDAASAKAVSKTADAVVIGSRIVQLLEEAKKGEELVVLERFIHEIRQALDQN
ncbi:MAG: tryptophan synthase subunit alpha [Burkholderiaceae bacterium]|nr:tryptophan synthase subunit alpha [Burkholderiaceae bacterium]